MIVYKTVVTLKGLNYNSNEAPPQTDEVYNLVPT
jgi:hypothetical protein